MKDFSPGKMSYLCKSCPSFLGLEHEDLTMQA